MRWKVASAFPTENLVDIINYYLGAQDKERVKKNRSLVDMTEEERQDFFKKACEAAHIPLDLSIFNKQK